MLTYMCALFDRRGRPNKTYQQLQKKNTKLQSWLQCNVIVRAIKTARHVCNVYNNGLLPKSVLGESVLKIGLGTIWGIARGDRDGPAGLALPHRSMPKNEVGVAMVVLSKLPALSNTIYTDVEFQESTSRIREVGL